MSSPAALLPPNASASERALSQASARLANPAPMCRTLWNPDTCPPTHLPWLAWALSVDEWDSGWTEAQKRGAIRASYNVHRYKGTVGAMRDALGAIGYSITLMEWHQESPPAAPYTFGLTADLGGQPIEATLWNGIEAVALAAKNTRSHLRYIRLRAGVQGAFYVGGTMLAGETVRVDPYTLTQLDTAGTGYIGCALMEHDITTVYPPGGQVPVLLLRADAPLLLASGDQLRLTH